MVRNLIVSGIIFLLFGLIIGCSSMPKRHLFGNETNIKSEYDAVWTAAVAFFAEKNVLIKTIEKTSGLIMAESKTVPDEWIDCGKSGIDESRKGGSGVFNVFIIQEDDGFVKVTVNSQYHCERWETLEEKYLGIMECNSTGEFESMLLDYITSESKK